MFGSGSLFFLVILAVLLIVPFWKLLPRYGISQYYAVLALMPAIALVLLWIMAFKDEFDGEGA